MNSARLRLLKEQIEEAFKEAPYPGDHEMVDDPDDWESADLMNAFRGKHWKELDHETLWRNSPSFLSVAGLRYYFPAYLLSALGHSDGLLQHTVYELCLADPETSPDYVELRKWKTKRFDAFTPAQKKAIKAFLEYVRDELSRYWHPNNEPAHALDQYWGKVDEQEGSP